MVIIHPTILGYPHDYGNSWRLETVLIALHVLLSLAERAQGLVDGDAPVRSSYVDLFSVAGNGFIYIYVIS